MGSKRDTTLQKQAQIKGLIQEGMAGCKIANKVEVSEAVVSKIRKKILSGKRLTPKRQNCGRKRVTTERDDIVLLVKATNKTMTLKSLQMRYEYGVDVSLQPIRRRLFEGRMQARYLRDKQKLTSAMAKNRKLWAKYYAECWTEQDWEKTSEEGKEDSKEEAPTGLGGLESSRPMTHILKNAPKDVISETTQEPKEALKSPLRNEGESLKEFESKSNSPSQDLPKTNGTLSDSSPDEKEENGDASLPISPEDSQDSHSTPETSHNISHSSPESPKDANSSEVHSNGNAEPSHSAPESPKDANSSEAHSNGKAESNSSPLERSEHQESNDGSDLEEKGAKEFSHDDSIPQSDLPSIEDPLSTSNKGKDAETSLPSTSEISPNSVANSKSSEKPQDSAQLEDDLLRPCSRGSGVSSPMSMEDNLLEGEEADADDDFSEEKLLLETPKHLSDDERSLNLFNGNSHGEDEASSDPLKQDKTVEKILRNLDCSLNKVLPDEKEVSEKKDNDEKVEPMDTTSFKAKSLENLNASESSIETKDKCLEISSQSLPVPDRHLNDDNGDPSDKRSLPGDFLESNKNVAFKMFRKSSPTIEQMKNSVTGNESKTNKISKEETKDKSSSKLKGTNTLSFSEALKSIAVEERLRTFDQPLTPLVPTAEIPGDVTAPSPSLTVLQPLTSRPKSIESLKSLPDQLPATEDRGSKRAAEDSEPETDPSVPKPDLKKVRVFPDKKDDLKKLNKLDIIGRKVGLTELSKQMSLVKTMESRLSEEKALQEAKLSREPAKVQEKKDKSIFIDEAELERRTAVEIKDAASGANKLKRIKRKDLESLVIELFVDKVLYEHQLGQQKDLCKRLEATLESNRKKAAQFHKEVEDLKKVTQRLQAEHLVRKSQVIAPVKVKRSVGIQATPTIIGKGLMHTSSSGNIRVLSASPGNPTWNQQVSQPCSIPNPRPADPSLKHIATQSTSNGTIRPMSTSTDVVKTTQFQTTRVVTSQPAAVPNSSTSTPTQMVMVNPVVVQSQNAGVGSPILPVGTTRLVRTPLTPLSTSNLSTTSTLQGTTTTPKANSNVIDLTDDEEASKSAQARATAVAPGSVLALQRTSGVSLGSSPSGQFVTLNTPSSMGQLVLVPSASVQPTTALVVGSVANNASPLPSGVTPQVRPAVMTPATRFSTSPQIPGGTTRVVVNGNFVSHTTPQRHPAPLPRAPAQQTSGVSKKLPPVPILKLSHKDNSIVLSWNMARTEEHERVASYQLYAYQEGTMPPVPSLWKKVGSVKALELPMACTLTQFMPGHVYHFAVRAVDIRSRLGPFSEPRSIRLGKQ